MKLFFPFVIASIAWAYCGKILVKGFIIGEITGGRPFYNTYKLADDPSGYWFGMAMVGLFFIFISALLATFLLKVCKRRFSIKTN